MNALRTYIEALRTRRLARRAMRSSLTATEELQIREFDGTLYLSHHDKPIVPVSLLRGEPCTALRECRDALTRFLQTKENFKLL